MRKYIFILAVLAALSPLAAKSEAVLIANKNVPDAALKAGDVELIFLGKKTAWSDGSKITVFMLKSGSVKDAFLSSYVGKTSSQFDTFWKQMLFTGKGKPPKTFASEPDLVKAVAETPGAVGVINSDTEHGKVKTITVQK